MTDPFEYEPRFEARLVTHAARATRPFDAAAIAAAATAPGRSVGARSWFRPLTGHSGRVSTVRVAFALALLALAVTAGAILVGSALRDRTPQPDRPGIVPPSSPIPPRPPSIVSAGLLPAGIGPSIVVGLPDGRIVVAGDGSTNTLAGIFEPRSGVTVRVQSTAPANVGFMAVLPDGRVVIYGVPRGSTGLDGRATFWLLDPRTAIAEPSAANLALRFSAHVALMADGTLLLSGGTDAIDGEVGLLSVEAFDPTTGTLTPLPSLREPVGELGYYSTALSDGRLLLVGDFGVAQGPNTNVYIYDPRSGLQRLVGQIHQDRYELGVGPVPLAGGRWLILGGEASQRCGRTGIDPISSYVFDPATDELAAAAAVPHSVGTATSLGDGRVVLTGSWTSTRGECSGEKLSDDWVGIYDPVTGVTVQSRDPMSLEGALPVDVASANAASVSLPDGTVALVSSEASIDIFDPGTP